MMRAYGQGHLDAMVTAAHAYPDLVRVGSTDDGCTRILTKVLSSSSDIDLGRRAGLRMPRVLGRRKPLSRREQDVYELMTQGRSDKEIANTLFINESTAKVHVRHIYEKLGVHTRAELARTALDELHS
jgi:DNA-binding NarL/FixJ family response regulator